MKAKHINQMQVGACDIKALIEEGRSAGARRFTSA
jgi:hypothetical protein